MGNGGDPHGDTGCVPQMLHLCSLYSLIRRHARWPRFIDKSRLGDIFPKSQTRTLLETFTRPGGFRVAQASLTSGGWAGSRRCRVSVLLDTYCEGAASALRLRPEVQPAAPGVHKAGSHRSTPPHELLLGLRLQFVRFMPERIPTIRGPHRHK